MLVEGYRERSTGRAERNAGLFSAPLPHPSGEMQIWKIDRSPVTSFQSAQFKREGIVNRGSMGVKMEAKAFTPLSFMYRAMQLKWLFRISIRLGSNLVAKRVLRGKAQSI